MPRLPHSAVALLLLVAIAAAAAFVVQQSWTSVTSYRSPYAFRFPLPAGETLTNRLVLVVLDGIRLDVSSDMSHLATLMRRGSSGTVRAALPSLSNPNRAVMATGAWPEINGVTSNSRFASPPVESIFSLARKRGLPAVVAGSSFWWRAFGEHLSGHSPDLRKGPDTPSGAEELMAWQQEACDTGIPFLRKQQAVLLVAEITAADKAGHQFGGASEAYRQVAQAVDRCLGDLVSALDDGQTTFVVVSDHGHIDRRGGGGHGGAEEEVLQVPLVLAGPSIAAGSGWQAEMVDIAPTISVLLGLPFPSTNQGTVLWPALRLPAETAQSIRDRQAQQKEMLASKLPSGTAAPADAKRQRTLSASLAAALSAGLAALILWQRQRHGKKLVFAVAVYYTCYYFLFLVLGLGYSLSAINREEYLLWFLGRNMIAAGVAFLGACLFVTPGAQRSGRPLVLNLALLIASTLALQVAAIHYEFGLIMENVLPDLGASFKAYLDLLQIVALAPGAAGVVFVLVVLEKKRNRLRRGEAESGNERDLVGARDEDR